jgi:hypothetical protein
MMAFRQNGGGIYIYIFFLSFYKGHRGGRVRVSPCPKWGRLVTPILPKATNIFFKK